MPIVLAVQPDRVDLSSSDELRPGERRGVGSQEIFDAVAGFLTGSQAESAYAHQPRASESSGLILASDFGWSVFLDTVGDKDPAVVKRELVHVKRGIPTNSKTNERKLRIYDGADMGFGRNEPPKTCPQIRGPEYLPRLAARVNKRKEYWSTGAQGFDVAVQCSVDPSPEWRQHSDVRSGRQVSSWKQISRYRRMHIDLWETFSTLACDHSKEPPSKPVKLGPAAVALLGFGHRIDNMNSLESKKIVIYLTRGDSRIRWLAIEKAAYLKVPELYGVSREVMLRTGDCCDTCALEQTASMPGKWVLIL